MSSFHLQSSLLIATTKEITHHNIIDMRLLKGKVLVLCSMPTQITKLVVLLTISHLIFLMTVISPLKIFFLILVCIFHKMAFFVHLTLFTRFFIKLELVIPMLSLANCLSFFSNKFVQIS